MFNNVSLSTLEQTFAQQAFYTKCESDETLLLAFFNDAPWTRFLEWHERALWSLPAWPFSLKPHLTPSQSKPGACGNLGVGESQMCESVSCLDVPAQALE